jgi:cell division protein FtsW
MGQRTKLTKRKAKKGSAKTKSAPGLNFDVILILVTITLIGFGLLMMHSASWDASLELTDGDPELERSPTYLFFRQLRWLALGFVAMIIFAWMDYHKWHFLSIVAMLVSIALLLAVLAFGEEYDGVRRSFSKGSVQPSELAKIVVVIYLAVWLYAKRDQLSYLGFGLVPLAAIVGIMGGLILSQPDLSAAAMVFILGGLMYYLAGSDALQTAALFLIAGVSGFIILRFNPINNNRIQVFVEGWNDILASSDHVMHSLVAFVRGSWFGVGVGRGTTKLTTLPFAHTDSVFAVVGEEIGVLGASFLVILYALLFWRGLVIARRAPDGLGSLLAAGLTMWITLEAYINMGSLLGLMPFAGNTLPFFSIGGSSLVMSMSALGIVFNVSRMSEFKQVEESRRTFGAIVSLRRRDWRRRVPGARRSRTAQR